MNKRQYYIENRERLNEEKRKYYVDNRERILEKHREYRERNKEKLRAAGKRYRETHKEEIREYKRKYAAAQAEKKRKGQPTEKAPLCCKDCMYIRRKGIKYICTYEDGGMYMQNLCVPGLILKCPFCEDDHEI